MTAIRCSSNGALVSQANWLGILDAVVHKAPVGYWEEKQRGTVECGRMLSPSSCSHGHD